MERRDFNDNGNKLKPVQFSRRRKSSSSSEDAEIISTIALIHTQPKCETTVKKIIPKEVQHETQAIDNFDEIKNLDANTQTEQLKRKKRKYEENNQFSFDERSNKKPVLAKQTKSLFDSSEISNLHTTYFEDILNTFQEKSNITSSSKDNNCYDNDTVFRNQNTSLSNLNLSDIPLNKLKTKRKCKSKKKESSQTPSEELSVSNTVKPKLKQKRKIKKPTSKNPSNKHHPSATKKNKLKKKLPKRKIKKESSESPVLPDLETEVEYKAKNDIENIIQFSNTENITINSPTNDENEFYNMSADNLWKIDNHHINAWVATGASDVSAIENITNTFITTSKLMTKELLNVMRGTPSVLASQYNLLTKMNELYMQYSKKNHEHLE